MGVPQFLETSIWILGTNISPFWRHFWVDDFPNFPRWDRWSFPPCRFLHSNHYCNVLNLCFIIDTRIRIDDTATVDNESDACVRVDFLCSIILLFQSRTCLQLTLWGNKIFIVLGTSWQPRRSFLLWFTLKFFKEKSPWRSYLIKTRQRLLGLPSNYPLEN